MANTPDTDSGNNSHPLFVKYQDLTRLYRYYLDEITPRTKERWYAFGAMLIAFYLRIIYSQGWYSICYCLSIFLLNQFVYFLTPKFDMSLQQDEDNEKLEAGVSDDFRPFIRMLPEFKFWLKGTRAILIASALSFTEWTNIPVYWPILVFYFITLLLFTMRRQINHMIKYKYIPFDFGKKRYQSPK